MNSAIKPLVLLVLAIIIAVTYSKACGDDNARTAASPVAGTPVPPERAPVEAAAVERPPIFTNREDKEPAKQRTERAMHAVYEQCRANHHAIREGSRVEGSHVDRFGRFHELVDVKIDLARPEAANGNTLWFQVDLTANPPTVAATKDIAARLCGLPGKENPITIPSAAGP